MSYSHVYKERGSRARQSPSDSSLLEIFPSNTPRTLAAYALLFVVGAIWLLSSPNIYPILSFSARMLWNTLVYITPPSLILALEKKYTPSDTAASATYEASRTFPAKSEAMQRILGLERMGVVASLQRSRSLSIASIFKSPPSKTLPGLGNWDNSCYQNSVLQGLASLSSLPAFLEQVVPYTKEKDGQLSTNIALRGLIEQLNDPKNAGRRIWTPYVLKNMSSFQQQDAQEYYSKVVDELEKEVVKSLKVRPQGKGLVGLKELTSPIESGR